MDNDSEEQLLKILSNPIRATIVKKLYDDSLTFTHLMQLTGCKTGQLSFHLKKLDYLVEQDELKRYRLSEKGKGDVEAILPMLGNGEKENGNSWDNYSGDKEGAQLGCAFKQFWDSLGLLILSFLAAIKHGILYVLGGLKAGIMKLFEKGGEFSTATKTHLTGERGGKGGLSGIKRKTCGFLSALPARGVSALKACRKALNPIFCYSLLIMGLLLFIPAVFSLAHPSFDPTLDSVARLGLKELTPEEISLANDLYAKEMLPNQRNYQGNDDLLMYYLHPGTNLYYEDTVGFPLSARKIKDWNEAKARARGRFVKDSVLSGLSLSLVLLLLGGILAYRRNAIFKRVLNSVITSSILLILSAVFVLLNINTVLAYSNLDPIFNNVLLMLKHLIALLFIILFSSTAGVLYLQKKMGKPDHTEDESAGAGSVEVGEALAADLEEESLIAEALDEGEKTSDVDQVDAGLSDVSLADMEKKSPVSGAAACSEESIAEVKGEGPYGWHEREGTVND